MGERLNIELDATQTDDLPLMLAEGIGAPGAGQTLVTRDEGGGAGGHGATEGIRQPLRGKHGWGCQNRSGIHATLAGRAAHSKQLEEARTKQSEFGGSIVTGTGRNGPRRALGNEDDEVAKRGSALEDAADRGTHSGADLRVAGVRLDPI